MPNDIKLQEGHPVDGNLRPLKVGGKSTAIETAESEKGARITGDLDVKGGDYYGNIEKMHLESSGHFIPAYSGMIIGYRMIGESATHSTYTFTTSYAVPDSDMNVSFIAPPSGIVEVSIQVWVDGYSNRTISFGLSDNATYNTIGSSYEVTTLLADETDQLPVRLSWVVSGLTAGNSYQYWLGTKATAALGLIAWGGTSANRYVDFIMKVVALPPSKGSYYEYN